MIDGTERRRQRPMQEEHYSVKKKTHTDADRNLVLVNNQSKKMLYLSPTVGGQTHDKRMADENPIHYPIGATLGKDTGFQDYEPAGVNTYQPKKAEWQRVEPGRSMLESYHFGGEGRG
jgi:hypothetical protein